MHLVDNGALNVGAGICNTFDKLKMKKTVSKWQRYQVTNRLCAILNKYIISVMSMRTFLDLP